MPKLISYCDGSRYKFSVGGRHEHTKRLEHPPLHGARRDDQKPHRGGAYENDSKLPSESELMADTGYSRSTVRHALKVLVDEGLVTTQRGRGAFVTHEAKPHGEDLSFSSYTKMMEHSGGRAETRTVDACMARAAGVIAKFFDVSPGSPLVKLVRMRYLDDAPLCLETTYLMPEFSPLIDENLDGSLYALLQDGFDRTAGEATKRSRCASPSRTRRSSSTSRATLPSCLSPTTCTIRTASHSTSRSASSVQTAPNTSSPSGNQPKRPYAERVRRVHGDARVLEAAQVQPEKPNSAPPVRAHATPRRFMRHEPLCPSVRPPLTIPSYAPAHFV